MWSTVGDLLDGSGKEVKTSFSLNNFNSRMHFCSMHKGQYTMQEFGHHQSMQYRIFPLPQNSHRLKERATGGNQFGRLSPKCPLCAESLSSAPAEIAAHTANVPNKC